MIRDLNKGETPIAIPIAAAMMVVFFLAVETSKKSSPHAAERQTVEATERDYKALPHGTIIRAADIPGVGRVVVFAGRAEEGFILSPDSGIVHYFDYVVLEKVPGRPSWKTIKVYDGFRRSYEYSKN